MSFRKIQTKGFIIIIAVFIISLANLSCEGPAGPQGPPGPKGPQGPVGPAGSDGSMIHAGQGLPDTNTGSIGDYYLDMNTSNLYGPKTQSGWGDPLNLQGSQGPEGPSGPQGPQGPEGPQGPPGEDGEDGQEGKDGQDGEDGEDGEDGSQIFAGEGPPEKDLGKKGDYYLDKDNYDLYGPKTGDGWGDPINLQGPAGEDGEDGKDGEDATVQAGTGLLLNGDTFSLDTGSTDARYIMPDENGGFYVPGEFGQGTIPVEGSGTRLMWYPGKAAFRAGRIAGTPWDDSNIGDYSVGLGGNVEASGNFSVAMGSGDATANYSVAMGNNSTASGAYSTAMGFATEATGETSIAFGRNTVAQAEGSFVIGKYNSIAGDTDDWIPTDPLFVAANGSAPSIRSNALTLFKNGNLTISGTLTQNSDRRLKKDIKPLESGILEKFKKIQAVRYRFKDGTGHPSDEQLGLIAQEVQAQFPELVNKGSDGYLSLSYSKMTTILLKGIQEQQIQIEKLKFENSLINQRLTKLEKRTRIRSAAFPDQNSTIIWIVLTLAGLFVLQRQKFISQNIFQQSNLNQSKKNEK